MTNNLNEDDLFSYWEKTWPKDLGYKDLKSSQYLFCPEMKFCTFATTSCYGCPLGRNERCSKLLELIRLEPAIIKELYKPVAELITEKYTGGFLLYEDQFFKVDSTPKFRKDKSVYFVRGKYSATVRFIPKYEKYTCELPLKNFFHLAKAKVLDFEELCTAISTGDIVYSLEKDDRKRLIVEEYRKIFK